MLMNTTDLSAMLPLLLALTAAPALAAGEAPRFTDSGCTAPDYPRILKLDQYQGDVTLAYTLGADGKVIEAKVVNSSGNARIDRESMHALRNCNFHTSASGGAAEPQWNKVKFEWVLE